MHVYIYIYIYIFARASRGFAHNETQCTYRQPVLTTNYIHKHMSDSSMLQGKCVFIAKLRLHLFYSFCISLHIVYFVIVLYLHVHCLPDSRHVASWFAWWPLESSVTFDLKVTARLLREAPRMEHRGNGALKLLIGFNGKSGDSKSTKKMLNKRFSAAKGHLEAYVLYIHISYIHILHIPTYKYTVLKIS